MIKLKDILLELNVKNVKYKIGKDNEYRKKQRPND